MRPETYREMAEVQDRHWWFVARKRILANLIRTLALPTEPRILEIGCGTGGNLAMLARFGRLCAMEYDVEARAIAASLGICPVAAGGLPDPVPFEDGQFDLICLLDVLEHIEDDLAALMRASKLLDPAGRLLVTVPAYAWLWSTHDEAHHHFRRYTVKSVRKLANAAGLSVYRLGYFNSLMFSLIAGARLLQKAVGKNAGSDAALPASFVNQLLTGLFGLERHIAPRTLFPFGTSVLAVLGKRP
ncbi:MAG: class I SAM-dependent methyltransferase [Deltaproteobacteria bacterium]|nr:class I SAM-dependent methyltransferase [Deltaproteobacteria bacterium]